MYSKEDILKILSEVTDPELPSINIVELKILRNFFVEGKKILVNISPTYSGCPALMQIKDDIISKLKSVGFSEVEINTVYSPDWKTEWLSAETKEKLKAAGIAPPVKLEFEELFNSEINDKINCPYCNSDNTEIRSFFGSTPCKSLYFCNNCTQPFEYFKRF